MSIKTLPLKSRTLTNLFADSWKINHDLKFRYAFKDGLTGIIPSSSLAATFLAFFLVFTWREENHTEVWMGKAYPCVFRVIWIINVLFRSTLSLGHLWCRKGCGLASPRLSRAALTAQLCRNLLCLHAVQTDRRLNGAQIRGLGAALAPGASVPLFPLWAWWRCCQVKQNLLCWNSQCCSNIILHYCKWWMVLQWKCAYRQACPVSHVLSSCCFLKLMLK